MDILCPNFIPTLSISRIPPRNLSPPSLELLPIPTPPDSLQPMETPLSGRRKGVLGERSAVENKRTPLADEKCEGGGTSSPGTMLFEAVRGGTATAAQKQLHRMLEWRARKELKKGKRKFGGPRAQFVSPTEQELLPSYMRRVGGGRSLAKEAASAGRGSAHSRASRGSQRETPVRGRSTLKRRVRMMEELRVRETPSKDVEFKEEATGVSCPPPSPAPSSIPAPLSPSSPTNSHASRRTRRFSAPCLTPGLVRSAARSAVRRARIEKACATPVARRSEWTHHKEVEDDEDEGGDGYGDGASPLSEGARALSPPPAFGRVHDASGKWLATVGKEWNFGADPTSTGVAVSLLAAAAGSFLTNRPPSFPSSVAPLHARFLHNWTTKFLHETSTQFVSSVTSHIASKLNQKEAEEDDNEDAGDVEEGDVEEKEEGKGREDEGDVVKMVEEVEEVGDGGDPVALEEGKEDVKMEVVGKVGKKRSGLVVSAALSAGILIGFLVMFLLSMSGEKSVSSASSVRSGSVVCAGGHCFQAKKASSTLRFTTTTSHTAKPKLKLFPTIANQKQTFLVSRPFGSPPPPPLLIVPPLPSDSEPISQPVQLRFFPSTSTAGETVEADVDVDGDTSSNIVEKENPMNTHHVTFENTPTSSQATVLKESKSVEQFDVEEWSGIVFRIVDFVVALGAAGFATCMVLWFDDATMLPSLPMLIQHVSNYLTTSTTSPAPTTTASDFGGEGGGFGEADDGGIGIGGGGDDGFSSSFTPLATPSHYPTPTSTRRPAPTPASHQSVHARGMRTVIRTTQRRLPKSTVKHSAMRPRRLPFAEEVKEETVGEVIEEEGEGGEEAKKVRFNAPSPKRGRVGVGKRGKGTVGQGQEDGSFVAMRLTVDGVGAPVAATPVRRSRRLRKKRGIPTTIKKTTNPTSTNPASSSSSTTTTAATAKSKASGTGKVEVELDADEVVLTSGW